MPHAVWRLLSPLVARNFVWLTVGMYEPVVRERLGYTWSARDERLHKLTGKLINAVFKLVPPSRRYHPRARAGWRREAGEEPAGAPLVETPRRNLPPLEERDSPTHYAPNV